MASDADLPAQPTFPRLVDLALLLLLATLWGSSYTLIHVGLETIPPLTLMAARTLAASAVLFAIIGWRGLAVPRDPANWRRFLFQACFNSAFPFTLIAWGQQTTDAALAAILGSTAPIFVFALTVGRSGQPRVDGINLFGVIAGFIGICLVIGPAALGGLGHGLAGQLAILSASVCFAIGALYGRRFGGLDPLVPAAGSLLAGGLVLAPISLVIDRPWTLAPSAISLLALALLTLFSTALAFVLYFRLLRSLGPLGLSAQSYLRVPIGVGLAVSLLGDRLAPTGWIGLVCVVVAVVAMSTPARSPAGAPAGRRRH